MRVKVHTSLSPLVGSSSVLAFFAAEVAVVCAFFVLFVLDADGCVAGVGRDRERLETIDRVIREGPSVRETSCDVD